MHIRKCVSMLSAIAAWSGAGIALGQTYPAHPIKLVTSGVGGGGDLASRLIAQGLTENLKQQTVIDNRPSGFIPGEIVATAPPDGYTLLFANSTQWIGPLLSKAPYDAVKDYAAVSLSISTPNIVVVNPSLPIKSMKDMIALARAHPGQLNYASTGTGSAAHLAGELLKAMAHIDIVRVSYKGGGAAMTDLISGEVQLMIPTAGVVTQLVKTGRLRAIAVASPKPTALAPGLPTVAASGLPGYEMVSSFGIFAPANTPQAIVTRISQETARALRSTDVRDKLFQNGIEAVGGTPEQLEAVVRSDIAKFGKLIKDADIKE